MIDVSTLIQTNKTICPAPFNELQIERNSTSGDLEYACCCNVVPQESSVAFEAVKTNIKSNISSPHCEKCYKHEESGGYSERMRRLEFLAESSPELFEQFVTQNCYLDHFQVMIKLSSRCPLACRSCNVNDSSTYAALFKRPDQFVHPLVKVEITEDSTVDQSIKNLLKQIHDTYNWPSIHLIGGEVLAQHKAGHLLDWLVDQGYASKFNLMFTTALSVALPKWVRNSLVKFKSVSMSYSIDSVYDNYEYVRWPSKFNKVIENLETMQELGKQVETYTPGVALVFSTNNIMYLKEILDFWMHRDLTLLPIHLINPRHLQIELLPEPYRKSALTALVENISHPIFNNNQQPLLKNYLNKMIDLLNNDSLASQSAFNVYINYAAQFDAKTNTLLKNGNHRIWELLLDNHMQRYQKEIGSIS